MKVKTGIGFLLVAALILSLVPAVALAEGAYGGLSVTGGNENTDYSYDGSRLTILTGTPLTLSGNTAATNIVISTNVTANLTLQDAAINAENLGAAIHLYDGATLYLTVLGSNTLRSKTNYGGIEVASGKTLVITEESTGTLNVTGGYDGAGIGGGQGAACGHITIWNGTINAAGSHDSAGIGGGKNGSGGTIVIHGGIVKATGGSAAGGRVGAGAGIGGGSWGHGGNITISGGTVEAKSSMWSAGIGGGWVGSGGTIAISGGTVKATGDSGGAGIGGGSSGAGGNITISGGTVEAMSTGNGAGIGGGWNGNGGTVGITGGVVFANSTAGPKDVGAGAPNEYSYEEIVITDGSLAISGTAALFLRNDTCPSPITSTHTHINAAGHAAGASVYGYSVAWSGNFGAYLFLYALSYDLGGGESSPANPSYYGPQSSSFALITPTKAGYTFTGWTGTDITEPTGSVTISPDLTGNRAYIANWTPNTYTVNYDANGGIGTTESSSHIYDTAKALTANGFTRAGYTFAGWATSTGGAAAYSNGQNVSNLTGDGTVTLFAVWTPYTYTVQYDANGGIGTTESSSHTYDGVKALTANGFTRAGHTFAGWATSTGGAATYSNGQSVSNLTAADGGSVTLYAVWTPYTYTVQYDANGGIGTTESSHHTYDGVKVLTANGFTRTGYTFAGWATSTGGAVAYSNGQSVSNLTAENGGSVTLFAVWTPYTYTVQYDANGGIGTTESSSHTYDGVKALTANGFTRAGYTFAGWATSTGGAAAYSNGQSVSNLTAEDGGSVTLYAVWAANTYTVQYDANGGIGTTESSHHTYDGVKALTGNGFTRTGYTFAGWATSTGGAVAYSNGQSVSNLTAEDGGSVTLFAVWAANTYTVNYDANGGIGTTESSSHTYDGAKALTVNGFTRTGYTFAGWATSTGGMAVYSNEQSVSNLTAEGGGTVTLYAVWTRDNQTTPALLGTIVNCTSGVNVRSGPGTKYSILGFAPKGAVYTVTGQAGAWYKIEFGGKAAYVSADYFSMVSALPGSQLASPTTKFGQGIVVNCNYSVNVRSGPGTKYPILGFARKGAIYTIIGETGAWYKIEFNGKTAYISASYFRAGNA